MVSLKRRHQTACRANIDIAGHGKKKYALKPGGDLPGETATMTIKLVILRLGIISKQYLARRKMHISNSETKEIGVRFTLAFLVKYGDICLPYWEATCTSQYSIHNSPEVLYVCIVRSTHAKNGRQK